MTFRDQPFSQRIGQMGDVAEGAFEYLCNLAGVKYVRYGLNRPPISLAKVSAFVRYTPDYLMGDKLVEVQGFGRDQKFKLKVDKLQALHAWSLHHPVWLWAWDSKNKRVFTAPIMDIALEANNGGFPQGFFDPDTNNPKAYWEIPASWFAQNGYQL